MTTLLALDSIADATPEQHAVARRILETAAPDLLPVVFGKPRHDNEKERMRAKRTADRALGIEDRTGAVDPAQSQHPTGDPGPFRALVCAWGRDNGWPRADSRKPLDPALLAAYRAASPKPMRLPKPTPARQAAYFGPSAEAKALRAVIRAWGVGRGLPVHHNGSLNPRLVEAYYAAHPEEA